MKNNLSEISDGHLYKSNDMVRLLCHDCHGCSECCKDMDESIILDPYDVYMLTNGLNKTFANLLAEGVVELKIVEGLVLPNIKMVQKSADLSVPPRCSFLDGDGRCSIHSIRPGICRLFPLGRNYDENGLSYFLLKDACTVQSRQKVKIEKWLGVPKLKEYESFLVRWHDLKKQMMSIIENADEQNSSAINTGFIKLFYMNPYTNEDFYKQFNERMESLL